MWCIPLLCTFQISAHSYGNSSNPHHHPVPTVHGNEVTWRVVGKDLWRGPRWIYCKEHKSSPTFTTTGRCYLSRRTTAWPRQYRDPIQNWRWLELIVMVVTVKPLKSSSPKGWSKVKKASTLTCEELSPSTTPSLLTPPHPHSQYHDWCPASPSPEWLPETSPVVPLIPTDLNLNSANIHIFTLWNSIPKLCAIYPELSSIKYKHKWETLRCTSGWTQALKSDCVALNPRSVALAVHLRQVG